MAGKKKQQPEKELDDYVVNCTEASTYEDPPEGSTPEEIRARILKSLRPQGNQEDARKDLRAALDRESYRKEKKADFFRAHRASVTSKKLGWVQDAYCWHNLFGLTKAEFELVVAWRMFRVLPTAKEMELSEAEGESFIAKVSGSAH